MIASHRADEITYYEEIGVAPGASPEEIRNAFRALVRLFHPDQQTDPQLKEIAEKQMRKLNRVYAVLSDPERRRRYDETLDGGYLPAVVVSPVFRSGLRQFMGRTAPFVAIILGAGLLIWLTPESITESTPGPRSFAHDQINNPAASPSVFATDQGSLIATLRSDLRAVTLERSAAIRELGRLRGTASEPRSVLESGSAAGNPSILSLTGVWFYAKSAQAQDSDSQALNQPENIEATISEQDGKIYGRYRARFPVADKSVSPDLTFAFAGPSGSGPQFTFPWTSAAGAKGELDLKVISSNSLRIDWHATEAGPQQGPDAGSAILTRRIE